jgi:hypothetical protein
MPDEPDRAAPREKKVKYVMSSSRENKRGFIESLGRMLEDFAIASARSGVSPMAFGSTDLHPAFIAWLLRNEHEEKRER